MVTKIWQVQKFKICWKMLEIEAEEGADANAG
jgi:hypothetical protein